LLLVPLPDVTVSSFLVATSLSVGGGRGNNSESRGNSLSSSSLILQSRCFRVRVASSGNSDNSITEEDPLQAAGEPEDLKRRLLIDLASFRWLLQKDSDEGGGVAVDFGVKGGELDQETRAPQKVDYYSVSKEVGDAAALIVKLCGEDFAKAAAAGKRKGAVVAEPTKFLGDKERGDECPLNGPWRLLFTTAADATFNSKKARRGTAKVKNVVNGRLGRITNVIDFDAKEDGREPTLKQLNVVIKAEAEGPNRVNLQFRYAKLLLTKFFGIPLFGWKLPIYIPVPAPFLTRLLVLIGRILRFGRKEGTKRKVPKAYFDVLYLDDQLRIHKTGDDNLFVQGREEKWPEAMPLFQ